MDKKATLSAKNIMRGRTSNHVSDDSILKEIAYFYIDESTMFMVCDSMILTIEGFHRQKDYFEKPNLTKIEYRMGIVNQLEKIVRHQSMFIWKNDKAFWTTYSGYNKLFSSVESNNGFINITRRFVPDSVNSALNANHTFTMKAPEDLKLLLMTSTFALFQNKMKLIVKNLRNRNLITSKFGNEVKNEGELELANQLYLIDLTDKDTNIMDAQYSVEFQMIFLLTDKGNIMSMELRKNEFALDYFFKNDEFKYIEFKFWENFLLLLDISGCLTIFQIKRQGSQNPVRKRKAMYVEASQDNSRRNKEKMTRTYDNSRKYSRQPILNRGDLHLVYERGSIHTKSFAVTGQGKENTQDENIFRLQSMLPKNVRFSNVSNSRRESTSQDPYAPNNNTIERKIEARVSKMMPLYLRFNKSSFINANNNNRQKAYLFSDKSTIDNRKQSDFNHPLTKIMHESQFGANANALHVDAMYGRDPQLSDSVAEFNDDENEEPNRKKDSTEIEMNLLIATFQANEATKNYNYYKSKRYNHEKKGLRSDEFYFQPCQQFELKSKDQIIQILISEYLNEVYLLSRNGWVYKLQRGLLEFQLIKIHLPRDPFVYGIIGNKFEVFLLTKSRQGNSFTVNYPFTALSTFGRIIRRKEQNFAGSSI